MKKYNNLRTGLFLICVLIIYLPLIGCYDDRTDRVSHDKRINNKEINKIFKDNYQSFEIVSEYLINNEGDYTIISNATGTDVQIVIKDGPAENKKMDDKVKLEAQKLINKLGFISIAENGNGIDFTKSVEGANGVITN